jgi:carboxyl-terminal processing protease
MNFLKRAVFSLFLLQSKLGAIAPLPPVSSKQIYKSQEELNEVNERQKFLEAFSFSLATLESSYIDSSSATGPKLLKAAIDGMLKSVGDPYTIYMSQKQIEELASGLSDISYLGLSVGAYEEKQVISEVTKHSKAYEAGLKPGDRILSIKKTKAKEKGVSKGEKGALKGEDGMDYFEIEYASSSKPSEPKKVVLTYSPNAHDYVSYLILSEGILYIRVSLFHQNIAKQVETIIIQEKPFLKGIILDVRYNPGGLFSEAVKLSNLFLSTGIIVSTLGRDRNAPHEVEMAQKKYFITDVPLVLLMNEGSASASEIVAGALKDHKRAFIIGQKSFGKGSVQSVMPLPYKLGGLKLTTATYATPEGTIIHGKGIAPNVYVSETSEKQEALNKDHERKLNLFNKLIEKISLPKDRAEEMKEEEAFRSWPALQKADHQLKVAYTYLQGILNSKGSLSPSPEHP